MSKKLVLVLSLIMTMILLTACEGTTVTQKTNTTNNVTIVPIENVTNEARENAKGLAVTYAKQDIMKVTFTKVEACYENDVPMWKIEFTNGTERFAYDSDLYTGDIIKVR